VLFVLVMMGWLDGSLGLPSFVSTTGLPTFVSTTAIMAAVATKTNPIKMTLNLRDILDQPCAPLTSEAGIGKAS